MMNAYNSVYSGPTLFGRWMTVLVIALLSFAPGLSQAQLSGTYSIPGDYARVQDAVAALNTSGVGAGGATFNVAAGHTETLTAKMVMTATGTSADPIIFQKSGAGANPVITSYVGTVSTVGTTADGMWVLSGSDFVTIDGIDLQESAANTTTTTQMEFGFGLFKASVTNGCQDNTIKNCVITLSRLNNGTWSGVGHNGSTGIAVLNATSAATTALTPTSAAGTNSRNKIYSNTIQNVNAGIVFVGFTPTTGAGPLPDPGTFLGDLANDVGGASSATGNTIVNFGGATAALNPATGVFANQQWGFNCSYNTINNNNGSGVNHVNTLRGIFFNSGSTSASATCNNNTVTVKGGGTTSQVAAIENAFGGTPAGNTVSMNNNTISGQYFTATSGVFYGIYNNNVSPTTLNISGNTINGINYGDAALTSTGAIYPIYTLGSNAVSTFNLTNNTVTNVTRTGSSGGTTIGIFQSGGIAAFTVNATGNTVNTMSIDGAGTSSIMYGIQTGTGTINCNNNTVSNLTCIKTTGSSAMYGIYNIASPTIESYNNNTIHSLTHNGTGTVYGIFASTTTGTRSMRENTIYGLLTGGTTIAGIASASSSPNISRNKIYNIESISTGSPTVSGIIVSSLGTAGNAVITNNLIGDLRASLGASTTSPAVRGINLTATTSSSNISLFYNTVNLNASSSGANFGAAALFVTTSATATSANLNLTNNILVNTSTPSGTGRVAAIWRSTTALNNFNSLSNNNLLHVGTPSASRHLFFDGTNADNSLSAYQARVTPAESASISEAPNFLSTVGSNSGFLHIDPATATFIEGGGTPIGGLTIDFDGDTRNASTPDIGADEFAGTRPANCAGIPGAGAASLSASTICLGQSVSASNTTFEIGSGLTYQWYASTTSGSGYVAIPGANGTSASYTPTAAGTYYVIMSTKCTFTGDSALTAEVILTVNAVPTATATSTNACLGQTVTLGVTTDIGTTFAWTGPGAFIDSIQSPSISNFSIGNNGSYSVLVTAANGCTTASSISLNGNPSPEVASVTANPTLVCYNGSTQLTGVASIGALANQMTFSAGTGSSLDPMTGATTLISSANDDTPSSLAAIGFSFTFDGLSYTDFSASPDGFIKLGSPAATSQFTNAVVSTTNIPKIYPYWDDLATGSNGAVTYLVTGTPGDRILKVQWFVPIPRNTTGAANSTFQAWLYENGGSIEFRYGTMGSGGMSASIGITASGTNYQSVTLGTPITVSTTAANNSVTGQPASGTIITFVNPALTFSWTPSTSLNSSTVVDPIASSLTTTGVNTYTFTATSNAGCSVSSTVNVTVNDELTASASAVDITCTGVLGSATVTPTGGNGTYTYAWSPSGGTAATATGLSAGTYTCIVTDGAGCTTSASANVNNPAPATITAAAGTNGSISPSGAVSVTCGTNQLFAITADAGYQIDSVVVDGVNQGIIGSYLFNNVTGNATINAYFGISTCNNPPTATTPSVDTICAGVNYTLNGSIGGGATTGTWSSNGTGTFDNTAYGVGTVYTPSAADITAGGVTITLTTNDPDGAGSCIAASSSTVLSFRYNPTVINGFLGLCSGGSTTLTAVSTPAGTGFSWSTGETTASITVNATGTYNVVSTGTNGCTTTVSATVVDAPAFTVSVAGDCANWVAGNSNNLTATPSLPGTYTYAWSGGGSTDTKAVTAGGVYTVTVTDVFGCSVVTPYTLNGAPLNGTYTIGGTGCGNFSNLANAVTHLSNYGVNGNVIIDVPAGYTETAPSNGFLLKTCGLASSVQPGPAQTVTIRKAGSGANPVLTAFAGGSSTTTDGIFKVVAIDNVTIDGINLQENAANTTNATRMEWGYAILKCDSNGANNIVIQNCNISLNKANTGSFGIYSASHGENSTTVFATRPSTGGSAADQAFRNRVSILNNTINNVYWGIRLGGETNASIQFPTVSMNDTLCVIQGNTITNFAGGTLEANGIWYANQRGIIVRDNTINGGAGSTARLNGINASSGVWADISKNNITLTSSGAIYGINISLTGGDASNPNIVKADSNNLTGFVMSGTSLSYGLYQSAGGAGAQLSVQGNTISGCSNASATATGGFYGIYPFGTGLNGTLNVRYNRFINNDFTHSTGTLYPVYGNLTTGTLNMEFNEIRNNILGKGAGLTYLLYPATAAIGNIKNNTIVNNRRVVASTSTTTGTTYGIYCLGTYATASTVSGNLVDSLYFTGVPGSVTAFVYGMYLAGTSPGQIFENNTVRRIFTSGATTGVQTIMGMQLLPNGANVTVRNNRISTLYTGAANNGAITGAQLAGSTTAGNTKAFHGNTISLLTAGGSTGNVRGIQISGGTEWSVYNNAISRISAPASAPTTVGQQVLGIDLSSTSTTVQHFIYNNSIYLTGSGGGTNFGSSGIHLHTGPAATLVNNLVINLINPGSAGHSVAFRRSSSTLTSYQAASNNNLFYAGTPQTSRLIYAEGVTTLTNPQQTLAGFKTYVGPTRDANSQTEASTPFINAATDSLLHIASGTPTFVESAGKPYPASPLGTDIDGDVRNSIAPDIGADEGNFTSILPQIISYGATPATGQCVATTHDVSVVTSASVTGVTLSYSYNGVAQTPIAMTGLGSGNWIGTIPVAVPANATVTWSVLATDGTYSVSSTGTPYQDEYLSANTLTPSIAPSTVCVGQPIALNQFIGSLAPAPTTYPASNATSTADEEIWNVTLGTINNTSTCTSVAPGAGSLAAQYGNYTNLPAPLLVAGQAYSGSVTAAYCGTTPYSNIVSVYIDFNRDGDFLDAGENAWSSAYGTKTFPSQVLPFTITIPSTVSYGLTRMRVVINESTTAPSQGTYTYGETEDYTVQLAGGAGFTYVWSDGSNTITPVSGSYTPAVAGTYNYSVTGTDPNGCTIVSASVPVTVNPLPSDPILTASSQCGNGVPALRASGGTAYNWYVDAVGGTPVQSGLADTLTSYSIGITTTFYVSSIDPLTSCESNRVAVVATVIQPDAVSASASSSAVCPGTVITLTATQTGSSNNYVFSWTGNGLVSNSGAVVTATITAAGSNAYTVTATDAAVGCVTTATVTVTGNIIPVSVVSTASPASICLGGSVNLSGGPVGAAPTTYLASNATSSADEEIFNVTFGTINNSSNCTTLAPGPGSVVSQYSNYTTSVAPAVLTLGQVVPYSIWANTCGGNYGNRTAIFIDWNIDGDFADAGENPVLSTSATGANFVTGTITVPLTATAGATRLRVIQVETTGTINPTGTYTWGETEDYTIVVDPNPGATYAWALDGNIIGSGQTLTHTPAAVGTTQYAMVVTASNGCTASFPANPVNVLPLPAAPIATASSQCGAGIPTASVASASGLPVPQYNWYSAATGGTLLQGPPPANGPLQVYYNNDFASSLNGAVVSGNASLTGGAVQLTPNVISNLGGLTIPASGINADKYRIQFNISTSLAAQIGADGISYSFADDASASASVPGAETGTGTKLKVSFDAYGTAGNGVAGIRLIYGTTISDPGTAVGTNGILAYSTVTTWAGAGNVPVIIDIDMNGKLTLTVNGSIIFSNVQLPASYLTDNKSNWLHVFKARTGGVSQIHAVDDITIEQSSPTSGYTTYNSSIATTTTFYVSEINAATGCESPRTAVLATVIQPDSVALSSNATGVVCAGSAITLTATNTGTLNNYSYSWSSSAGSGITTPLTGSTITVTPTTGGTFTYTVTATDSACTYVNSLNVAITANPTVDSVNAIPAAVCAGSPVQLNAYTIGAGPQTQPTGYLASNATSTADEEILNVTFGTMSQSSACGTVAPGAGSVGSQYSNYTASVPAPTVVVGQGVTYSVQAGTCGGNFTNRTAIFIDWNRDGDFLDANENPVLSTPTSGPHVVSGTITVPSTASAGVTRMRVITVETSGVIASTGTYTWGETEDYIINVLALSDGGNTWVWSPGGATGSQVTVNPTTTTAYTVTATNASGCTATSAPITVNVTTLISAPIAVDGLRCGFGPVDVSAVSTSGATTPAFNWYANATGGTPIQSGASATLSGINISVTDTFYVAEVDLNSALQCESPRTPVIMEVIQPDPITATTTATKVCQPNTTVTLDATQSGNNYNYDYSWTAVPPVGSGLSGVTLGPVSTLFSSNFTSSTVPSNVTLAGTANINNGVLQINPNAASQSGAVSITGGGNAADTISVTFDLIVPQTNGADGISYSYCDDGVLTGGALNNESGTGTKLAISFDSYTNGSNTRGIYLMYPPSNQPTPTSTNVLAYSSNVTWAGSATPNQVAYTVSSSGLFNLTLNGTPVFTNVQLPAGYLTANKSNWAHFFKARTGAITEEHSIDNMTVNVAQFQSLPTPGQSLTVTPTLPGTYTYYALATEGDCNAQSSVTVTVNPPAAAISAGVDLEICSGTSVTLNATGAGLIPALRFTESLWQVNAGTGNTGAGIPAWTSTWYTANGGTTADMLEITNLGSGLAASAGVVIEFWNAASVTSGLPVYSYTIPSTAPLMPSGGLLYFSHSGSAIVNDLTNNFFTNGQNLNNGSGTAGGWVMRKNGVVLDAVAVSNYSFPAASGVTSSDWSGTIPSNSALSGSILTSADNNTSSSWTNTSVAVPASVGTLNPGLVANLPSLGTVSWSSIPAGFSGTNATSTFGPITQPTEFVVMFDNGDCQSYDTVLITPVSVPAVPTLTANIDSICGSGNATYTVSNGNSTFSYQWQTYNTGTQTWNNIGGATSTTYVTPVFSPLASTSVIYRANASCGSNTTSSVEDTLYILNPQISSIVNDTVCGAGVVDLVVNGDGNINWYATSSSAPVIFTGNTYSPTISSTQVFWVRAGVGTCLDPAGRQPVFAVANPAPAVAINPSSASICFGASTTLTASSSDTAYVYTWSTGATGNSIVVTPDSSTTYTLVGTNSATTCSNTTTLLVTVNSLPNVSAVTATPSVACPGLPFTLSADAVATGPQTPPSGYCAAGGSTTTADEQIFGVSFAGMSNLSQGENCLNNNTDYTSTIAPITVNAGGTYPFTVVTDECDGATYFSSGLAIYIDYNRDGDWNDAGEQAYTTTTTTISPNTRTGNITIPLTATVGVTRMRVVVVESNASPTACGTFSFGEAEDYLVNIQGPAANFSWSPVITLDNPLSATPTSSGITATTDFTVTVTSSSGCTSTGTVTVTATNGPEPQIITPDTSLCNAVIYVKAADAGAFGAGGYPAGTTFTWKDITGGDYLVNADSIISNLGSSFYLTVTTPSGCVGSSDTSYVTTKSVSVNQAVTDAGCIGSTGSIAVELAAGSGTGVLPPYSYVWSTDASQTNILQSATKTNNQDTLSNLGAGTYYLLVSDEAGSPNSCSSLIPFIINSPPAIDANASGTDVSCFGLGDGSVTVNWTGGTSPYTINWSDNTTDTQSANSIIRSNLSGVTLTAIVTDGQGCADTVTATVIEPTAVTVSLTSTIASSFTTTDGSAAAVASGGTTPYTYEWFDESFTSVGTGASLSNVGPGLYFCLLVDGSQCQTASGGIEDTIRVDYKVPVSVTLMIEGYSDGAGAMQTVLLNAGEGISLTETDTIRIELRNELDGSVVHSETVVMNTDGEAGFEFGNSALVGGNYYIALLHRSAVQTWSANAETLDPEGLDYDFTTAASQAYGDNQVMLSPGQYALFSGDVNQDFVVDFLDQVDMDNDVLNFGFGYLPTDVNGDGIVDFLDQITLDNNVANFVGAFAPF